MLPSNSRRRRGALRAAATLSVIVLFPLAGCVRNATHAPDEREEIAVWDFPVELPPNTLHLWPTAPGSPLRSKRHLDTKMEAGKLTATVAGDDPQFVWQIQTPINACGVHVVVDVEQPGPLQLFWNTQKCPVFSEACSITVQVEAGRQVVEFLLDSRDPLRELRLDPPDRTGARLVFEEISVLPSAELGFAFAPNASIGEMSEQPSGLYVDALAADPWITAQTPGLDADRITAAELVLRAAPGTVPQLYWGTASTGFSEPASARFEAIDAGGQVTHRVKLRGRKGWAQKIDLLRLDPGAEPGRYVIERLALVHDPAH
jgi:hypothetical protein